MAYPEDFTVDGVQVSNRGPGKPGSRHLTVSECSHLCRMADRVLTSREIGPLEVMCRLALNATKGEALTFTGASRDGFTTSIRIERDS